MKKRSSNPIELRRSSGAVKVDLSSADKTIRRPGSEPDLNNSPIRSSLRQTASGKALIKAYLFDINVGNNRTFCFSSNDKTQNLAVKLTLITPQVLNVLRV